MIQTDAWKQAESCLWQQSNNERKEINNWKTFLELNYLIPTMYIFNTQRLRGKRHTYRIANIKS